ncbi:MAG: MmgE/PrpD family protein [Candidatus Velthaea sp.]
MTAAPATLGATRDLAAYVAGFDPASLAGETLEHAKQAVLDLIGIAVRARAETQTSAALHRAVGSLDPSGACTGIGYGPHYAAQYAALLNGANFHVLDFDDTHERSSLHPGAPVIAAALAAGEERHCDGQRLIAAIVAGYDVVVRIGLAALPAVHYARGFHPTATAGVFGATAAVTYVHREPADVVASAFGINASQAAGSLQFAVDGAQTKPLQVGFAAHNAVVAHRFAVAGISGPAQALEGRSGFLHAYSDGASEADVFERWDGVHEIDRTAFKPYPCCRYMHSAIDTLGAIVRERALTPDDVELVRIALPAAGMRLCAHPEEAKRRPRSIVDAQFSMYYAAAATLLHGSVRWDDYAQRANPRIAELIERIEVVEDPAVEALFPQMAARVQVEARGVREDRLTPSPRGEPADPLGWDDIIEKFHDLAAAGYDAARRERIVEAVRRLDEFADVRTVTAELGPVKA